MNAVCRRRSSYGFDPILIWHRRERGQWNGIAGRLPAPSTQSVAGGGVARGGARRRLVEPAASPGGMIIWSLFRRGVVEVSVSTFGGDVWIDVADRDAVDVVLGMVDDDSVWKAPQKLWGSFYDTGRGWRIAAYGHDGYRYLPDFVVHLMARSGVIIRAFIALDHDEYGAEHIVLGMLDGQAVRVHHRYIHPGYPWWRHREGSPWLTDLPAIGQVNTSRSGRLVDGPSARSALADLYGVPLRRIRRASWRARRSASGMGVTYEPFFPWFDALDITFQDPPATDRVVIRDRSV